jgi:hypothetical protein
MRRVEMHAVSLPMPRLYQSLSILYLFFISTSVDSCRSGPVQQQEFVSREGYGPV